MSPVFDESERRAALELIHLALNEDLADRGDLTTAAIIPPSAQGAVSIVARRPGIVSGLPIVPLVFQKVDPQVRVELQVADGDRVDRGTVTAVLTGSTRSLLIGERTALNFLTHLSGVASLTRKFVDLAHGTRAKILDTRKTLPGWRALEKYAVRCGGGVNHRMGLYDGVLIKDNHLAAWIGLEDRPTLREAVTRARTTSPAGVTIEVEVDSLAQLQDVLQAAPDIVLLDNMPPDMMREAIALRDQQAPQVRLEASGSVTLDSVAAIAATGVDRISIGALTHSAPALDLAFDWGALA
ncbi:Nicotinate-nucleotide pyrophosphorylase [carboxylating] [Caulifigura coniformis]|uniref:Probable nicotinate-nucleotide pyrophosphorylase [carboxylating] n=1 Tax=Caulifigura coniformis TaxID=2527983 RepID=A0A517SCX3_9PLAN|nr:carboxylating nicotinate-nucleotide diphosphorylase [Caulifigura coniformis]QDT53980.1 Nicotinate-nucleotide pyrophosphorylase [carboxylating] [Caulifigura coniformis]